MKQQYIDTIMELGKGLPAEDRPAFAEKLRLSEPTLQRYLSGDIRKFDVADKIIDALKGRLEEKMKTEV